jgi:hypothetical protein
MSCNLSKLNILILLAVLEFTKCGNCVQLDRNLLEQWLGNGINQPLIDLKNRQVTSVDSSTFNGLSTLYWLSLSDNFISSIDENTFDQTPNIFYLYIFRNKLTQIN